MELQAGSTIGHNIVLERELGRGAAGTVWLAENRSLQAKVAVKVLSLSMTGSDAALTRFSQEARLAAQLESPHVLRIYDFGVTEHGQPYIVMERLVGRDLRAEIEARGPIPCQETALILKQLCRALKAAHQLGLVHRDIKPANLFMLQTDGEPFLKVLDFGIARVEQNQSMSMTETGSIVGTPYYMSPEQFVDPRQVDPRSDLWSATVVAYGCLLGQLPFHGGTVGALSLAVHSGSFAKPTDLAPSLPRALDAFFERGLQVDPSRRYQSADELNAAFHAAVQSSPRSSGPMPSVVPQSAMPSAANPGPTYPPSTLPSSAPAASSLGIPSTHPSMVPAAPVLHGASPQSVHGPAAVVPTASSFAADPMTARSTSNRGLWMALAFAVVGLGALGASVAIVHPSLLGRDQASKATEDEEDEEDEEKRSDEDERDPEEESEEEAKPDADASGAPDGDAEGPPLVPAEPLPQPSRSSAAKTASTPVPAPAPRPSAAPSPGPSPAPSKPKWRPRKMTCAKFEKSKSCSACCLAGDKLMPFPSCECFFDGEKWDREHGVAP